MNYTHLPPQELRERLTGYRQQLLNYLHDGKIEAFTTSERRADVVINFTHQPGKLLRYEVPITNSARLRILQEINQIDLVLDGSLRGKTKILLDQVKLMLPPEKGKYRNNS